MILEEHGIVVDVQRRATDREPVFEQRLTRREDGAQPANEGMVTVTL
jgi:hypothetical protein